MEENYIWKINGAEIEFDMEDAETAERYTSALGILSEADELRKSDIDYPTFIHRYCEVFRKFYDAVFGNGASEKIFDGIKDNIRKYDEVYDSMLSFIVSQKINSAKRINTIISRYAPKKKK